MSIRFRSNISFRISGTWRKSRIGLMCWCWSSCKLGVGVGVFIEREGREGRNPHSNVLLFVLVWVLIFEVVLVFELTELDGNNCWCSISKCKNPSNPTALLLLFFQSNVLAAKAPIHNYDSAIGSRQKRRLNRMFLDCMEHAAKLQSFDLLTRCPDAVIQT